MRATYSFPLVPRPADEPTLVGTVNADDHRPGLMPRTLEQAFGPGQRSSTVALHVMVPRRQHLAEKAAAIASALVASLLLITLFIIERTAS